MTRPAIPTATSVSSTPASRLPYFSRSSGIVVVTGSSTGYGSMPSSIILWRLASRTLIWPGRSSFCAAAADASLVVTDNRLQRGAHPRGFGPSHLPAPPVAPVSRLRRSAPPAKGAARRLRGMLELRCRRGPRVSDVHRETPESRMRRRPPSRSTAYAAVAITYASAHHTCKDFVGRMTAESPSKTTLK